MDIKYLLMTASDSPKNIFEVFSKKYASNQGRKGMNILFWYEKNFVYQLFELNTNSSIFFTELVSHSIETVTVLAHYKCFV
jgi:hypothetical protein